MFGLRRQQIIERGGDEDKRLEEMNKDWDTDWKKAFAFDPVLSRKDRRPIEERPDELDKVLFRIIR